MAVKSFFLVRNNEFQEKGITKLLTDAKTRNLSDNLSDFRAQVAAPIPSGNKYIYMDNVGPSRTTSLTRSNLNCGTFGVVRPCVASAACIHNNTTLVLFRFIHLVCVHFSSKLFSSLSAIAFKLC